MLRLICVLICALAACASPRPPAAQLMPASDAPAPASAASTAGPAILSAGLESRYVLQSGDGEAYLGVLIRPPEDTQRVRPPVALALVVDTSGSMKGQKIEHARFAARSVAQRLGDDDQIAVVRFSSDVQILYPRVRLGDANRGTLNALIESFTADDNTNLYGGLLAGLAALEGSGDAVRRVLLISDGQATTEPNTAAGIVAALPAPQQPTILSTIGVGADYDAAIMSAVAEHGGGGFHHLTDSIQLAGILETELDRARAVAGTAAVLTITPEPGTKILGGPGLAVEDLPDGRVRIAIGEVFAGETRTVSIKVKLPPKGPRTATLGTVALQYQPVDQGPVVQANTVVQFERTPSLTQVAQGEVPAYMVAADRMRVAHVLSDAAALLKEGDLLEAQAVLRDERARLQTRRARLDGPAQVEADALIALFNDPIVDAELGAAAAPNTDQFDALLEIIRQGGAISGKALVGLPKDTLRILRNAAYARHGYRFKAADLTRFFQQRPWYRPDAGFRHDRLTPQDVRTVTLIKTWEKRAGLSTITPVAAHHDSFSLDVSAAREGKPVDTKRLRRLSLKQLRILRNASYARHGYTFRAQDLRAWFGKQKWYRPDAQFDPADLTPTDTANVRTIKQRERALLANAKDSVRELELRSRARARQAVR